ncbi:MULTISPECIES: hypothetical protein [Actinomadura]|uniref:Uncharacterized protein n=1 Tax=Actinomadura geliboluensis TaxID=882440 RepID=A0A5S4GWR1_9ACTN|nr:hypothetical protein [Actinomadura geliboluensis]TMR37408.1 hypothetical protein ETD96_18630 [Actinomadura geliboluensis]
MSDSFEAHASGFHGGMHAGAGDINNIYYLLRGESFGASPRKQPTDELRWLRRRFVEPAGLGRARDVLETFRSVFLDGLPGSGRIAAAKMLLWELGDDRRQIHELVLQENENAPRIDRSHVGDGDLVWLDLSRVAGRQWDEVHNELSPLRATVHDHDAHLVIVLPDKTGSLGSALDQYRIEIQRPAVDEVLARYLLAEEIPRPAPLPPLRFLDADRRMEEVDEYVGLIRRARDEHREGSFTTWCEEAFRALARQARDVAERVAELTAGRQRALLLAVAMLHGAHADVIHQAGASLLTAVAHPCEDSPLLERVPLDQRLKEIGAEVDSSGSVQFEELNYDAALRSYFWAHMPELRDALQDWVKQTADSPGLSAGERRSLVERFTEQCLNERYRPTLVSLVEEWTTDPTTTRKMEAAAVVVQRGLRDEQQARSFRRQIYDWARTDSLSQRLAEVIIVACRDEMMARHPDEALVRLHHVARRERGTRARETLIELVSGAPRLRRQMLTRLTDPKFMPGRWHRDIDLFLQLVDPKALTDPGRRDHAPITESTVRQQLTIGWSLVFSRRPHDVWTSTIRRWLHVAAEDERNRHALLDVLVGGGEAEATVLARLYAMTREREAWAPLGDLVIQDINAAWGARTA